MVCHNPEQADRDRAVRERLVGRLAGLIDGSDGWGARRRDDQVGQLRTKPGLRRFLRRTKTGLLRIDRPPSPGNPTWTARLLRTSDLTLTRTTWPPTSS